MSSDRFSNLMVELEARYTSTLTTREVARAVRALSAIYVERRENPPEGGALGSAGKRAAFALFYAPLHWLTVTEVVRGLGLADRPLDTIVDLGCGTGSAGAAWASAFSRPPRLEGFDKSTWATTEAAWLYRTIGLHGSARRADIVRARLPGRSVGIIAAFSINEIERAGRARVLERLLTARENGARVLVVEPIARRLTPWWDEWSERFRRAGGRDDDWRFRVQLPERLRLLGRAAGLDQREITARTLFADGSLRRPRSSTPGPPVER